MLSLFKLKHDVTLDHVQLLFTLSLESYRITMGHAFFDFHQELFSLLYNSFSFAMPAVLGVDPSLALAVRACLLHLHLHEAHIDSLKSYALTIAFRTDLLLATFCT